MEIPKFNESADTGASTQAPSLDFASIMLSELPSGPRNPQILEEIRKKAGNGDISIKPLPVNPIPTQRKG